MIRQYQEEIMKLKQLLEEGGDPAQFQELLEKSLFRQTSYNGSIENQKQKALNQEKNKLKQQAESAQNELQQKEQIITQSVIEVKNL